jgi:hypothetical protein
MAVCGYCWVCRSKFICHELASCGQCTEHKPLQTFRPGEYGYKICGLCERDIESGAIGSLIEAIRAMAR